jgi:hypothetical protein
MAIATTHVECAPPGAELDAPREQLELVGVPPVIPRVAEVDRGVGEGLGHGRRIGVAVRERQPRV